MKRLSLFGWTILQGIVASIAIAQQDTPTLNYERCVTLAHRFTKQGDANNALALAQVAIKAAPLRHEACVVQAEAHFELGQFEAAVQSAEQAYQLAPLSKRGALAHLAVHVARQDASVEAQHLAQRGQQLLAEGKSREAAGLMERAWFVDTSNVEHGFAAVDAWLAQGALYRAVELLQVMREDPEAFAYADVSKRLTALRPRIREYVAAKTAAAVQATQDQQHATSIALWTELSTLAPYDEQVQMELCLAYASVHDWRAIAAFEKAVDLGWRDGPKLDSAWQFGWMAAHTPFLRAVERAFGLQVKEALQQRHSSWHANHMSVVRGALDQFAFKRSYASARSAKDSLQALLERNPVDLEAQWLAVDVALQSGHVSFASALATAVVNNGGLDDQAWKRPAAVDLAAQPEFLTAYARVHGEEARKKLIARAFPELPGFIRDASAGSGLVYVHQASGLRMLLVRAGQYRMPAMISATGTSLSELDRTQVLRRVDHDFLVAIDEASTSPNHEAYRRSRESFEQVTAWCAAHGLQVPTVDEWRYVALQCQPLSSAVDVDTAHPSPTAAANKYLPLKGILGGRAEWCLVSGSPAVIGGSDLDAPDELEWFSPSDRVDGEGAAWITFRPIRRIDHSR